MISGLSDLNREQKKILILSVLGTALEFYDFTLFSIFAIDIGRTFFPAEDELLSIMAALGAFAAGFIMRPFGGMFLGNIGDKHGRRYALALSILLMGIPALVTGFLPGYATLGIISPILIVLVRLVQGLSAGGEFNGAAIFVLEHISHSKKAFISSWISVAGGFGALSAMLVGGFLHAEFMPEWAWRLAFIFGATISILGFILRRTIEESPEFLRSKLKPSTQISTWDLLKKHRYSVLMVFIVGALDGSLAYVLVGFSNIYLTQFIGVSIAQGMYYGAFGLVCYLIATPICGSLYDLSNPRSYMQRAFCGVFLLAPLVFFLFQLKTMFTIVLGEMLLAFMFSLISGSQHAFMQHLFPVAVRYRGIAFSFNLGSCLLGGTCPLILTWLMKEYQHGFIPSFYIMLEAFLALVLLRFCFVRI